jgi:hypothetical protein
LVDAQTVGVLVTAASVTVAAIYYVLNLRISQRNQELSLKTQELALKSQQQNLETRQAQLFTSIYQNWSNPEFQNAWYDIIFTWKCSDYDDFMEKYGPYKNLGAWTRRAAIGTHLEGVGVLVKKGLVDVHMVDDLMSGYIIGYWEKFGSVTNEMRRVLNSPTFSENVEYLYNEVKRIYVEEHPGLGTPSLVPSVK